MHERALTVTQGLGGGRGGKATLRFLCFSSRILRCCEVIHSQAAMVGLLLGRIRLIAMAQEFARVCYMQLNQELRSSK
jgi:hypothetical protein